MQGWGAGEAPLLCAVNWPSVLPTWEGLSSQRHLSIQSPARLALGQVRLLFLLGCPGQHWGQIPELCHHALGCWRSHSVPTLLQRPRPSLQLLGGDWQVGVSLKVCRQPTSCHLLVPGTVARPVSCDHPSSTFTAGLGWMSEWRDLRCLRLTYYWLSLSHVVSFVG